MAQRSPGDVTQTLRHVERNVPPHASLIWSNKYETVGDKMVPCAWSGMGSCAYYAGTTGLFDGIAPKQELRNCCYGRPWLKTDLNLKL